MSSIFDPYSAVSRPTQVCSEADHVRKKNCSSNPWCVYGLGEKKEGIYKINVAVLGKLGSDPASLRRIDGNPVGIKNLGATCYLNVLIQSLFHNLLVRDAVFNLLIPESNMSQMDHVLRSLQVAFGHLHQSNTAVHNIVDFTRLLQLNEQEQQDPQEFYKLFMSKLDNLQNGLRDPSRLSITQILRGEEAYSMECGSCHVESSRTHAFSSLELPIEGLGTVQKALDAYFEREEMTGENQYSCENCDRKRDAVRCTKIAIAPALLNIQLLRYIYDRKTFEKSKLQQNVEFDDTVVINGETYRLVSVLYHKGKSAYGGHYVAEVVDWNTGQWWHCDDEDVTATENPALSSRHGSSAKNAVSIDENDDDNLDTPIPNKGKGKGKLSKENDDAVLKKRRKIGKAQEDQEDSESKDEEAHVPLAVMPAVTISKKRKSTGTAKPAGSGSAPKQLGIRLDRAKDAYMFSYAREELFLQAQHSERIPPSQHVVDSVGKTSDELEASIVQYATKKQSLQQVIDKRKSTYEAIRANMLPVNLSAGFHLVPAHWLRQWVTGVRVASKSTAGVMAMSDSPIANKARGLVDLTDESPKKQQLQQMVLLDDSVDKAVEEVVAEDNDNDNGYDMSTIVFDDAIQNLPCQCSHRQSGQPHLDFNFIGAYKVVSDKAFQAMMGCRQTEQLDYDFKEDNYRCEECCAQFLQERQRDAQSVEKYRSILNRIATDDRDVDFKDKSMECFFVANKWLSSLRRFCDMVYKAAEQAASGKVVASKSAKPIVAALTVQAEGSSSANTDPVESSAIVDVTVNGTLMCEHAKMTGSNRAKKISMAAWHSIRETFPDALEWSAASDLSCQQCADAQKSTSDARKQSSKEKGDELSNKADDLRALLKRTERTYPMAFDYSANIQRPLLCPSFGEPFFLVDRNWLNWWRSYHEIPAVGRPDFLTNHTLRCMHGLSYMSEQFSQIAEGKCPCDHPKVSTLGDGLPPAEVISAPQWRALCRLYGSPLRAAINDGNNYGDDDDDVVEVTGIVSVAKGAACGLILAQEEGEKSDIAASVTPPNQTSPFAVRLQAMHVNGQDLGGEWRWDPVVCTACVEQRRCAFLQDVEEFTNRYLTMVVLKPSEADPLFSPNGAPSASADVSEDSKDKENERAKAKKNEKAEPLLGKRRSSRKTKGGQTFDISASSSDTLALIKLKNSERLLENFDGKQTLYHKGKELVGNDLTLSALGVHAGDMIHVRVTESSEQASFADLLMDGSMSGRTEVGFQGTFLSFNNNNSRNSLTNISNGNDDDASDCKEDMEVEGFQQEAPLTGLCELRQMATDLSLCVTDTDVECALRSTNGVVLEALNILLAA